MCTIIAPTFCFNLSSPVGYLFNFQSLVHNVEMSNNFKKLPKCTTPHKTRTQSGRNKTKDAPRESIFRSHVVLYNCSQWCSGAHWPDNSNSPRSACKRPWNVVAAGQWCTWQCQPSADWNIRQQKNNLKNELIVLWKKLG